MDGGCLRAAIGDRHADQNVAWRRFGIFDRDIEIPFFIKDARIEQFKFRMLAATPGVLLDELLVGVGSMGVLIQRATIAVRQSRILVVVELLHVLAVIAFGPSQAE
jgi:hypothetical protein